MRLTTQRTRPADGTINRREALRRSILFSTGALFAGQYPQSVAAEPVNAELGEEGMHVLAVGDYGTKGDKSQRAVADAMAHFAEKLDDQVAAVFALGDNFYGKIGPERFNEHFEQLYSPEHLGCPFYACAGNHDYGTASYDLQEGKLQLQLDYAKENPTSRWKMPAKWYAVDLPNADNPLVRVIILDGNFWEGGLTPPEKIAQRRFLEAELQREQKAPWLWMVNHFPLFSDSVDRGDDKRLIREWRDHLRERFSLCLAGHDHTMQHLRVDGFAPSFIVSGAGGAHFHKVHASDRGFSENRHLGFNHMHVTAEQLTVQFLNAQGECLHRFERDPSGRTKVLV